MKVCFRGGGGRGWRGHIGREFFFQGGDTADDDKNFATCGVFFLFQGALGYFQGTQETGRQRDACFVRTGTCWRGLQVAWVVEGCSIGRSVVLRCLALFLRFETLEVCLRNPDPSILFWNR